MAFVKRTFTPGLTLFFMPRGSTLIDAPPPEPPSISIAAPDESYTAQDAPAEKVAAGPEILTAFTASWTVSYRSDQCMPS